MAGSEFANTISAMESQFLLSKDAETLFSSCSTLRAVRDHLSADPENSFCKDHARIPQDVQQTWLLHRDVLHALIMPIVALYSRTAMLAEAALCSSLPEDLEIAYREDARSAFLFLQCFIHDQEDWCYTHGCPTCVAQHTLSEEASLRLAITATLLADDKSASWPSSVKSPAPLSAFLPALQHAAENDPFWGAEHWAYIHTKAKALHSGIQSLMTQASELESLVLSPRPGPSPVHSPERSPRKSKSIRLEILTTPASTSAPAAKNFTRPAQKLPVVTPTKPRDAEQASLPKLRPSPLAKQQIRLDREQRALLGRAAWQVYSAVAMPAAERMALRRGRKLMVEDDEFGRGRSLTT